MLWVSGRVLSGIAGANLMAPVVVMSAVRSRSERTVGWQTFLASLCSRCYALAASRTSICSRRSPVLQCGLLGSMPDCLPYGSRATICQKSSSRFSGLAISHSQITRGRHPKRRRSSLALRSRATLAANFDCQNSRLVAGVVANRQPGCLLSAPIQI
jgi:hypothetical protein